MNQEAPDLKALNARKKPTQHRSQQRVKKILDATATLLKESPRKSSRKLTTNLIAREAGVPVGSIYQYFPNMESILFALYQEITAKFHKVLDDFNSEVYLSMPRDQFFKKLFQALQKAEPEYAVGLEVHNAMKTYPLLAESDKEHAESVAAKIASFMQYYGSNWPLVKLHRLALYVYYIDFGTWLYLDHIKPPKKEYEAWELNSLIFNIEQCFD